MSELKELMESKRVSQAALCRYINSTARGYNVTPSEVSNAVNGVATSPKMQRIIADSLRYLKTL